MATTYKILGQVYPTATTDTPIYTVPSSKSTVCSTLVICNQSVTPGTFRIAVQPAGITVAEKHYIAYDAVINGNDTITLTIGITLATTDVISVRSSTGNVSFSLFGSEIS